MREVETVEFNRDKGIAVSVYFGQQKGSANTTDTEHASIEAAVSAACDIAKATASDPFSGLADQDKMATDFPELDLYHPWDIKHQEAIELAGGSPEFGMELFEEWFVNHSDIPNDYAQAVQSYLDYCEEQVHVDAE